MIKNPIQFIIFYLRYIYNACNYSAFTLYCKMNEDLGP